MYFTLYYFHQGPHVFVRIFAGPDWEHSGLVGNLTFRKQEWEWFMRLLTAGIESPEHLRVTADKHMSGAPRVAHQQNPI